MEEEFITFEIARKLKEKGFKGKCLCYYDADRELQFNIESPIAERMFYSWNSDKSVWNGEYYDAPTIFQALKWLREEKGIDVLVHRGHISINDKREVTRHYCVNIYLINRFACTIDNDEQDFLTYEEAVLAGIEYTLDNLI